MTVAELLQLKKRPKAPTPEDEPLEWLVTNGLGGYACGSVDGLPRRRFHGLLVAAHPAPAGRLMLLRALDETVTIAGGSPLALHPTPDNAEQAARIDFYLEAGVPHWVFDLGHGLTLEQSVLMPYGQNTVLVRYRLSGDGAGQITIRPWVDIRSHDELEAVQSRQYQVTRQEIGAIECTGSDLPCAVRMSVHIDGQPLTAEDNVSFVEEPRDWNDFLFAMERDRGYACFGSMHAPGAFTLPLSSGREVYLSASSEPGERVASLGPHEAWQIEVSRREKLVTASHRALQEPDTFLLPLAAEQFIVKPVTRELTDAAIRATGAEPRTVIAGYPWFTDWGRDTMISLEGLVLTTGRAREARDILQTFARAVRQGVIPNLFPERAHDGVYHTADATMWFFHALSRYDDVSGDTTLVQELLPTLEDIVAWHQRGTLFNIRIDSDGLLTQGVDSLPLTWMDATCGGWVVTPRRGKTVEINALWHNALALLRGWLVRHDKHTEAEAIAADLQRCRDAFNARFWNQSSGHLFDLVDGDHGDDATCRPNQVMAISVAHSPLARERWSSVLDAVTRTLLTPFGLRTLPVDAPDFQPRYFGDLRARDAAYHQGTVWPWLIGPYLDAWLAVHPESADVAEQRLAPLMRHLIDDACVGSISEIFDAVSPFAPRGCFAQAWSVAEAARLTAKIADIRRRTPDTSKGREEQLSV